MPCSCGPTCTICGGPEILGDSDVQHILDCLVADGFVEEDGQGRYRITGKGERRVEGMGR